MIPMLPEKHVWLNETLLGVGALLLVELKESKTVDQIWSELKSSRRKLVPERLEFDDLVLTIDFLFALGTVKLTPEGKLCRCA